MSALYIVWGGLSPNQIYIKIKKNTKKNKKQNSKNKNKNFNTKSQYKLLQSVATVKRQRKFTCCTTLINDLLTLWHIMLLLLLPLMLLLLLLLLFVVRIFNTACWLTLCCFKKPIGKKKFTLVFCI